MRSSNYFQSSRESDRLQIVNTEHQLTAFIFLKMERYAGDAVSGLKVNLQDRQIEVSARVNQSGLILPGRIVVEVGINGFRRQILRVIPANTGLFPVPGDMVSDLEVVINNAFRDESESMASNLQLEAIVINDGVMTSFGRNH